MYDFEAASNLELINVYDIYRKFSNQKLPDIYKKFAFGRELIIEARGAFLKTKSGKTVLDLTGGLGVANFGHNHDSILKVRKLYNESYRPEIHKSYLNPFLAAASKNLSDALNSSLRYSFFCNSGAEAVDGALKISFKRYNGNRRFVLHSDRSFHGKTIGAGSISAGDNFVGGKGRFYFQKIPNVLSYEFNSIDSIISQCNSVGVNNVYAIFVEPFSCSTLTETSEQFLLKLREFCNAHNITLVFDEIYSGFAKCGPNFYFQKYGTEPDIICLSKALGGGKSSISAYVTNPNVYQQSYGTPAGALTHSTTYNSFGEECATAMEACRILVEENLSTKSLAIEAFLFTKLNELKNKYPHIIHDVRGAGTHFGLVIKDQFPLFAPIVKLIPIDFTSDPLFLKKLYTTALANSFWEDGNMLVAFTSNQDVILNISPAPITKIKDLEMYLSKIDTLLAQDPKSLVTRIIKGGFSRV